MCETSNPYEPPQTQSDEPSAQEKKWRKWRQTRDRGRRRFVWLNGVLGWGVTTGVFWSIWMAYTQGWDKLPLYLLGGITLFPIGGYWWGSMMWAIMEKNYKKECCGDEDG